MAAKSSSKTDRELADLQALLGEEGVQKLNTGQRAALAQQGIQVPHVAPDTLDAANAGTIPATETTETSDADEELNQLTAATEELGQTRAERRAADKLRETQPESDAAIRQGAADQAQELRGLALRQAQEGQRRFRDRVNGVADQVGSLQTPGGLGMLLLILALLLLILIQTNGQPRLIWLWLVLTRKAHLMTESDAKAASTTSPTSPTSPTVAPAAPATASNGDSVAAFATGLPSAAVLAFPSALDRYIHP